MLQRSPSFVLSLPTTDPIADLLRKVLPRAPRVPGGPLEERADAGRSSTTSAASTRRGPGACCRSRAAKQLPDGYDVDTHFTPAYEPWDQRMCLVPDGDFFAAIKSGQAEVVTDHIEDVHARPGSGCARAPSCAPTWSSPRPG